MKKKILLIIGMFLIITNVNALTFNVGITNIEDKGNNGTIGSIESIDLSDKTIDVLFQDVGDEVSFELTINNTGEKAGTLKSISVTSTNNKIEYTNNLPENGLSINGEDTNKVTITAKVLEGATSGTSSSEIKIKYNYDVGSCPDGEILSDDESMCYCSEGYERNENGICVKPGSDKIDCEKDEIYNETKKICEKKEVTPVPDDSPSDVTPSDQESNATPKDSSSTTPSNPKTLDNIILITLLFIVSGLGIYAVMFKKLKTFKQKKIAGLVIGVITLGTSFGVLAGVFGIDNLLSAIINPITKSKELVINVNETIDLIETWDGECSVQELTPANIFEGGSGTENDPYQIKTAEQLSCFAKSVNKGTHYVGEYIKQTKNIKLNDHLNDNIEANSLENIHRWNPIGNISDSFSGTYDGDNHIISGLYLNNSDELSDNRYMGFFGNAISATFKNIELSDVYVEIADSYSLERVGVLLSNSTGSLTIDNVKTYGKLTNESNVGLIGGIVSYATSSNRIIKIENVENNINLVGADIAGIINYISATSSNENETTVIIRNATNNGNLTNTIDPEEYYESYAAGIVRQIHDSKSLLENLVNNGNIDGFFIKSGGLVGTSDNFVLKNSHNTGEFNTGNNVYYVGGLVADGSTITIDNCYNSGNFNSSIVVEEGVTDETDEIVYSSYGGYGGIAGYIVDFVITNSYNTGKITGANGFVSGLVAQGYGTITDCYNAGDLYGITVIGGLLAYGSSSFTNCYNTGDITVWGPNPNYEYYITLVGGIYGGDDYTSQEIDVINCYNTGDIKVLSTIADQNASVGGLVGYSGGNITNSYNRGNLYSKYSRTYMCGIGCGYESITNSYNAGTITFDNAFGTEVEPWWSGIIYAGISSYGFIGNSYNLGDININDDFGALGIGGTSYNEEVESVVLNSVNTGNLTLTFNAPLTNQREILLYGISSEYPVKNSFNAGTLSIIDNTDGHTTSDPNLNHEILVGEITKYYDDYSRGNKFTNESGHAIACYPSDITCTLENSALVGTYTTESAPAILSIINGDGAYNDTLDESGLPTLKVFNN